MLRQAVVSLYPRMTIDRSDTVGATAQICRSMNFLW